MQPRYISSGAMPVESSGPSRNQKRRAPAIGRSPALMPGERLATCRSASAGGSMPAVPVVQARAGISRIAPEAVSPDKPPVMKAVRGDIWPPIEAVDPDVAPGIGVD